MDFILRRTKYTTNVLRVAFVVFSLSILTILSLDTFAAAPVIDASAQGPALKDLNNRVKRLETRMDNQGLVDLMNRFDQLQRDMQRVIGDLEVQSHQLKTLQKQQKDLYADIDRRMRKLEQAPTTSSVPVSPAPGSGLGATPVPVQPAGSLSQPTVSSQGTSPQAVSPVQVGTSGTMSDVERNVARSAYERAFNLLKQKRYSMAITSFKAFLDTYPYASYADNAQYWLGEANYASKKYEVALKEFQQVVSKYPNSPKRADAMLKIGYTYVELGNNKMAKHTLSTIVSSYPGSTAAKLAEKRIKALK